MEKHKAIPQGYMTVGEVAKKVGVTVRTLQYYDKQGLLSPSGESEGGRRLYTNKDVVLLHQIISMKQIGFSLDDIKNRLVSLETPQDVAKALTEQAETIRKQIDSLSKSLKAIEALKTEVLQMQSVNFKAYADIIVNLQMENEFYWLIKNFDDDTLDHIRGRFDKESGLAMMNKFNQLQEEAIRLKTEGVQPDSEIGIAFAKKFWDMITEFTEGDMSLLPKLLEVGDVGAPGGDGTKKLEEVNVFLEPALEAYFDSIGYDPFKTQL